MEGKQIALKTQKNNPYLDTQNITLASIARHNFIDKNWSSIGHKRTD